MKYNQRAKKGGAKQFKKAVGRAWMHATADQRVAIASAMNSKRYQRDSCAMQLPRILALARIIPYASRRPAVMKRITRLEKHLFNQRAPTSPLFRPGSGSQPSKSGDSTTSPDANACSSKRPWWEVLGVSPDCDASHVRKAFRFGCQSTHPDKGGTHEAFCEVYAAYEKALLERHEHPLGPSWSPDAFANDAYSVDIPV